MLSALPHLEALAVSRCQSQRKFLSSIITIYDYFEKMDILDTLSILLKLQIPPKIWNTNSVVLQWRENEFVGSRFYMSNEFFITLACSSIQHLKLQFPSFNEDVDIKIPAATWQLRSLHMTFVRGSVNTRSDKTKFDLAAGVSGAFFHGGFVEFSTRKLNCLSLPW